MKHAHFAELYTDFEFVQTLSAQITWSHINCFDGELL
jgi:hypothetical protein